MARILVADDEAVIREMVKGMLLTHDHVVDLAESGPQAVGLIKKNDYDLVILDWNMPGMTGLQVASALRSVPKFAKLRILMLTAATMPKEIDAAYAAGVNDYIIKPMNMKLLMDKVAKALAT